MACNSMSFEKTPDELFNWNADFSDNMASTEIIVSKAVTAEDQDGEDATATVIESSAIDGMDQVEVVTKGGVIGNIYTITVHAVTDADTDNEWDVIVDMTVVEKIT